MEGHREQESPIDKNISKDAISRASDPIDLSSYEVKLNDAPSTGHKKNLSEHFEDVLNITSDNTTSWTDSTAKEPVSRSQSEDEKISSVLTSEPMLRLPSTDHLSFDPSGNPNKMHDSMSSDVTHNPSSLQHNHSIQTHQFSSSETSTPGHLMPPPPPVLTPSSTDSRKHRREISKTHPMAHRRKNTNGELEKTKWSYDRNTEVDVITSIEENPYKSSPSDSPPQVNGNSYFHQGYYEGQYGRFVPPQTYFPFVQSCSGASYNMGSGAVAPGAHYGQYQWFRTYANAEPVHSTDQQYPPLQEDTERSSGSYRTSLNAGDGHGHVDIETSHRKQASLGAFQATTDIFEEVLKEMEATDQSQIEASDEGYNSAPENIEEYKIQATTKPIVHVTAEQLSSSFDSKTLNEDSFFQQLYKVLHEDDDDAPVVKSTNYTREQNYSADDVKSTCMPVGLQNHGNAFVVDSAPKRVLRRQSSGETTRHRRHCAVVNCPNRVVQGGLCISHGAKRKTCNFPGCIKNVKKQGKCSTHGPERKRCEAEGCVKVAVQGGKCISHGAKKKGCGVEGCLKQSM